ncbi:unnamed protein product, partial [Allacma fusca]
MSLVTTTKNAISAISSLGLDMTQADPLIVRILVHKLDDHTHLRFHQSLIDKNMHTLKQIYEFLHKQATDLASIAEREGKQTQTPRCKTRTQSNETLQTDTIQTQPQTKSNIWKNCPSNFTCKQCNQQHHTLLHASFANIISTTSSNSVALTQDPTEETKLKPTAIVQIGNPFGTTTDCRALIDNCSDVTLIGESLVKKLGLPRA